MIPICIHSIGSNVVKFFEDNFGNITLITYEGDLRTGTITLPKVLLPGTGKVLVNRVLEELERKLEKDAWENSTDKQDSSQESL